MVDLKRISVVEFDFFSGIGKCDLTFLREAEIFRIRFLDLNDSLSKERGDSIVIKVHPCQVFR